MSEIESVNRELMNLQRKTLETLDRVSAKLDDTLFQLREEKKYSDPMKWEESKFGGPLVSELKGRLPDILGCRTSEILRTLSDLMVLEAGKHGYSVVPPYDKYLFVP